MNKKILYLSSLVLISGSVFGQFIIRPGTTMGFSQSPDIVIQAAGAVNTNSVTDFADAKLQLNLAGTDLAVTGDLTVTVLRLSSEGNKTINNTLTISEGIEFTNGILVPSTGKVLFTGAGSAITGGSNTSYVDGLLYQTGGGYRFYPLGVSGTFSPATFENIGVSEEVAVQVVDQDAALTFDPLDIISLDNSRYWEIQTTDPSAINSRVSLSLNSLPPVSDGSYAVIQASSTSSNALNLGFSSLDDVQVTSRGAVTNAILVVGVVPEVVVKVRDLITPFIKDEVNDKLYIEKIEAFDFNNVTLLDRWGVVVKRWENYTNDVDYDFSNLSPGNYIVVVEFGNLAEGSTTEKISQMVTVLKTN